MNRIGTKLTLAVVGFCLLSVNSWAANRIRVQTLDNVAPGASGVSIGVFISNDVSIQNINIPLEIRTVSGGAYLAQASLNFGLNTGSRMDLSPLGTADPGGAWPAPNVTNVRFDVPAASNTCSGPTSSSWQTAVAGSFTAFTSPDALFYTATSVGDPSFEEIFLVAGDDGVSPSMRILCSVNSNQGIFEVDSCCRTPANHVSYVDADVNLISPEFVKGRIGIGVTAAVKELEIGVIPQDYALEQNYPNPFNAGTVIRFMVPTDGNVKIDVYNILGRKVRTLVDEFRVAGTHQTDWDGHSDDGVEVSTGVYFYRITADRFTNTRKMVLLK